MSRDVNRTNQILRLIARASRHKLRGNETAMVNTLADGFLELGGIYVKFLQGILLQLPIMLQWESSHRMDVYEDVQSVPLDIINILRQELSPAKLKRIAQTEPQPFAAGSFGQVYKARLNSGELIVIKVLRPGARKFLKSDLRFIKLISRMTATIFTSWSVDINSLMRDFTKNSLEETDYLGEAKFANYMYENYLGDPTIVIPKTYMELCTDSIIVQEYIEGLSIVKLIKHNGDRAKLVNHSLGSDLEIQLKNLGISLFTNALHSRPIHGDPHPGNIRLLANNKVALLDFGIQARPLVSVQGYYLMFKEWWRTEYLGETNPGAMFLSYVRFYAENLFDSMQVISIHLSKRSGKQIQLDDHIMAIANRLFSERVSPATLRKGIDNIRNGKAAPNISVSNIVNAGNRFQITAKVRDAPLLRSMVTYISLVTELGYRPLFSDVMNTVIEYVHKNLPELEVSNKPNIDLPEAIEILYTWLEQVAQQDFQLYRQLMNHLKGLNI